MAPLLLSKRRHLTRAAAGCRRTRSEKRKQEPLSSAAAPAAKRRKSKTTAAAPKHHVSTSTKLVEGEAPSSSSRKTVSVSSRVGAAATVVSEDSLSCVEQSLKANDKLGKSPMIRNQQEQASKSSVCARQSTTAEKKLAKQQSKGDLKLSDHSKFAVSVAAAAAKKKKPASDMPKPTTSSEHLENGASSTTTGDVSRQEPEEEESTVRNTAHTTKDDDSSRTQKTATCARRDEKDASKPDKKKRRSDADLGAAAAPPVNSRKAADLKQPPPPPSTDDNCCKAERATRASTKRAAAAAAGIKTATALPLTGLSNIKTAAGRRADLSAAAAATSVKPTLDAVQKKVASSVSRPDQDKMAQNSKQQQRPLASSAVEGRIIETKSVFFGPPKVVEGVKEKYCWPFFDGLIRQHCAAYAKLSSSDAETFCISKLIEPVHQIGGRFYAWSHGQNKFVKLLRDHLTLLAQVSKALQEEARKNQQQPAATLTEAVAATQVSRKDATTADDNEEGNLDNQEVKESAEEGEKELLRAEQQAEDKDSEESNPDTSPVARLEEEKLGAVDTAASKKISELQAQVESFRAGYQNCLVRATNLQGELAVANAKLETVTTKMAKLESDNRDLCRDNDFLRLRMQISASDKLQRDHAATLNSQVHCANAELPQRLHQRQSAQGHQAWAVSLTTCSDMAGVAQSQRQQQSTSWPSLNSLIGQESKSTPHGSVKPPPPPPRQDHHGPVECAAASLVVPCCTLVANYEEECQHLTQDTLQPRYLEPRVAATTNRTNGQQPLLVPQQQQRAAVAATAARQQVDRQWQQNSSVRRLDNQSWKLYQQQRPYSVHQQQQQQNNMGRWN